jgi:hypothetical protein
MRAPPPTDRKGSKLKHWARIRKQADNQVGTAAHQPKGREIPAPGGKHGKQTLGRYRRPAAEVAADPATKQAWQAGTEQGLSTTSWNGSRSNHQKSKPSIADARRTPPTTSRKGRIAAQNRFHNSGEAQGDTSKGIEQLFIIFLYKKVYQFNLSLGSLFEKSFSCALEGSGLRTIGGQVEGQRQISSFE